MRKVAVTWVLSYLRFFARLQLAKIKPIIVGVGGSSGKTSLSEILSIALAAKYTVKQGRGKNSETGIPLDVLGITMKNYAPLDWLLALLQAPVKILINWEHYDVYVVEMGIDGFVEPKNMSYLLKIIQPHITITTNISLEHTQYFDTFVKTKEGEKRMEELFALTAQQELLLLQSLPASGTAIINLDDPTIAKAQDTIVARTRTVSLEKKSADVAATHIGVSLEQFFVEFTLNKKAYAMRIPALLPKHYASSLLMAIAVCDTLHVDISKAIQQLETNFSLPAGRSSVFAGIKDTTIIDSTYNNATLPPVLDMLDLLKTVGRKKRTIAIIGDMRELGSMSKHHHEVLAQKIADTVDVSILIGPLLREYAVPILKKRKAVFASFSTFTEAKDHILATIQAHDLILVKGSQNTLFLERVVEMLLADKKDKAKLTRRGIFWDRQRSKTL